MATRPPSQVNGQAVLTRKELIKRWQWNDSHDHCYRFQSLEKDGILSPIKPGGSKNSLVVYFLSDVLAYEQQATTIMRGMLVQRVANEIRLMPRPSAAEWQQLWYALSALLGRLSPIEKKQCAQTVEANPNLNF